ncbi:hypothetical protein CEXT_181371 [Caerostris extrusa]|uniref:Uncharacterized protein n=1 Tax=Caerostris extrusa TaxID=172846 RepID=A0AAV4T7B1_CAEEX|nr:hypothetical protein CEXT_181371 [Caerostris extrusa]
MRSLRFNGEKSDRSRLHLRLALQAQRGYTIFEASSDEENGKWILSSRTVLGDVHFLQEHLANLREIPRKMERTKPNIVCSPFDSPRAKNSFCGFLGIQVPYSGPFLTTSVLHDTNLLMKKELEFVT